MLVKAMDVFQVAKRQHKENVKNQYNDMKGVSGAKTYFRASELGSADRKIIYGFFAHQLPKQERSAKNLRQLENGDFVHERYQSAWEEMGILISKEERLTSKEDPYLASFDWEWAGHYDGLLDINIIKAFADGYANVTSERNEETGEYEIVVDLNDEYGKSIGFYLEDGSMNPEYQPFPMVADIKTMNPWFFKKIKEKADVSGIVGYIDQISFYMYMLGTPYGSIFIEAKDSNDVLEVQIVWRDFYGAEAEAVTFDESIHGKQRDDQVRVTIDSARFFGGEGVSEGVVQRVDRLNAIVKALRDADGDGDAARVAELMPGRCDGVTKPDAFPCSWGHKNGPEHIQYCEYFTHCWNEHHKGLMVHTYEATPEPVLELIPEEFRWVFFADGEGSTEENPVNVEIHVDNRKVPPGINYDAFIMLVESGSLDYTKFLADVQPADLLEQASSSEANTGLAEVAAIAEERDEESQIMQGTSTLFAPDGTLNIGAPEVPSEAEEYIAEGGAKAILCLECKHEITYQRLGNGGTKKCTFCGHTNRVKKI